MNILPPATSTYVLQSQGSGKPPVWAEMAGGQWTQTGSYLYPNDLSWNVGIGTTTPASALTVYNSTSTQPILTLKSDTGTSTLTVLNNGNVGIGTTGPGEKLEVIGDVRLKSDSDVTTGVGSGVLQILNAAGTAGIHLDVNEIQAIGNDLYINNDNAVNTHINNLVHITTGGNVGIGTTSPGANLHVFSNTNPASIIIEKSGVNAGDVAKLGFKVFGGNEYANISTILQPGWIRLAFNVGSGAATEAITINSTGNVGYVGIGDNTPAYLFTVGNGDLFGVNSSGYALLPDGSASTPALTFTGDTDSGLYRIGADKIGLITGGSQTQGITIDSSGNVGIGTTTPSTKLTITANDTASSTITNLLTLEHLASTGGGVAGIGSGILFSAEASDNTVTTTAQIASLWNASSTAPAGELAFYTKNAVGAPVERMRIDEAGNVGIGTTTPAWLLHVFGGGICVDAVGGGTCPAEVAGAVAVDTGPGAAAATSSISFDIAERYPSKQVLEAGDLVAIDEENPGYVKKTFSGYQSTLLGVVSYKPAIAMEGSNLILGPKAEATSTNPFVVLSGRVPVKVSLENGPIEVGDLLTSGSSTPGVAMKATEPGRVIGMALEPFNGTTTQCTTTEITLEDGTTTTTTTCETVQSEIGKIMVFVNPHWSIGQIGEDGSLAGFTTTQEKTGILDGFAKLIKNSLAKLGLFIEKGIAKVKELIAGKITTKEICLEGDDGETICVTKAQLEELLKNFNNISNSSTSNTSNTGNTTTNSNNSTTASTTASSTASSTETSSTETIEAPSCTPNWQCAEWQPSPEEKPCGEEFIQVCLNWVDKNNCGLTETPTTTQKAIGTGDAGTTSCDASLHLVGECQNTCVDGKIQVCTPTCKCAEGYSDCDPNVPGCETASSTCPTD